MGADERLGDVGNNRVDGMRATNADSGAAFCALYEAHVDIIHACVQRIVHDPATAADITQETFLVAWGRLPDLENPHSLRPWLLRVARNKALNHVKTAQRSHPAGPEVLAGVEATRVQNGTTSEALAGTDGSSADADPAQAYERAQVRELVRTAATALDIGDRHLYDMYVTQEMGPAEIAEAVGTNRNAAKQAVHRLRGKLAGTLRAAVLWHGGKPSCKTLRRLLETSRVSSFDRRAVRLICAHTGACPACHDLSRRRLRPRDLLPLLPFLLMPQARHRDKTSPRPGRLAAMPPRLHARLHADAAYVGGLRGLVAGLGERPVVSGAIGVALAATALVTSFTQPTSPSLRPHPQLSATAQELVDGWTRATAMPSWVATTEANATAPAGGAAGGPAKDIAASATQSPGPGLLQAGGPHDLQPPVQGVDSGGDPPVENAGEDGTDITPSVLGTVQNTAVDPPSVQAAGPDNAPPEPAEPASAKPPPGPAPPDSVCASGQC